MFHCQISRAALNGYLRVLCELEERFYLFSNFGEIIKINGVGCTTTPVDLTHFARFIDMLRHCIYLFQNTIDIPSDFSSTFECSSVATTKVAQLRTKRNMNIDRNTFRVLRIRLYNCWNKVGSRKLGTKTGGRQITCISWPCFIVFI